MDPEPTDATKADQMYQAAVAELDDSKAKKLWQDLMHYRYDIWDANAGVQHA